MPEITFERDPRVDARLRAALVDLWVAVTNAGGTVGFPAPVTRDEVRPVAETSLVRVTEGRDHLVVARRGGELVGFGFLVRRPGPLFRHWASVERLQVRPELQGTGLGSALLTAIHEVARDLGLEQLRLSVRGGTGTERFYERHGYEVVARLPDTIRVAPDDTREELWLMRRL